MFVRAALFCLLIDTARSATTPGAAGLLCKLNHLLLSRWRSSTAGCTAVVFELQKHSIRGDFRGGVVGTYTGVLCGRAAVCTNSSHNSVFCDVSSHVQQAIYSSTESRSRNNTLRCWTSVQQVKSTEICTVQCGALQKKNLSLRIVRCSAVRCGFYPAIFGYTLPNTPV